MPRAAILIVDGFERGHRGGLGAAEAAAYPWIRICLGQLERHPAGIDYSVELWDNARLPSHATAVKSYPNVNVHFDSQLRHLGRRVREAFPVHRGRRRETARDLSHAAALDRLLQSAGRDVDYVVTLDSDAFPIADRWLEHLVRRLEEGATLAGIYRDEMAEVITPFVHVSCLAVRRSDLERLGISFGVGKDVGHGLTRAVLSEGGRIAPLRRSNKVNYHFLMGGVYGDLVYHQGAGSRRARFWTSNEADADAEEAIRVRLRDRAFRDLEGLVSDLTGRPYPN